MIVVVLGDPYDVRLLTPVVLVVRAQPPIKLPFMTGTLGIVRLGRKGDKDLGRFEGVLFKFELTFF